MIHPNPNTVHPNNKQKVFYSNIYYDVLKQVTCYYQDLRQEIQWYLAQRTPFIMDAAHNELFS